ncbi:MAG: hypothetical protein O9297_14325 [Flavobacterium sp.]|uniref:hypothetical protein n=1 Tax=Flavobacterium sp. TaxID=239 RepID=UPI0022BAA6D0|nr:hypothetical protein [Flavobacterium sp.]MCZ8298383.1 hypothetical protein [Flavobacterium sp.]
MTFKDKEAVSIFQVSDSCDLIAKDAVDDKVKGKFLFGNRRRAPWEGYYTGAHEGTDVF